MADTARIDAIIEQINAFGEGTEEYHECLGFLLMTMARSQWRRAEHIRRSRIDSERRRERARRPRSEQRDG